MKMFLYIIVLSHYQNMEAYHVHGLGDIPLRNLFKYSQYGYGYAITLKIVRNTVFTVLPNPSLIRLEFLKAKTH